MHRVGLANRAASHCSSPLHMQLLYIIRCLYENLGSKSRIFK